MTFGRLVALTAVFSLLCGALSCGATYYLAGLFVDETQALNGLWFGLPVGAAGGVLFALVVAAPLEWLLWRMRHAH